MKKVLALIVAFALCFTAFAGCFATSAAQVKDYTFSISAATDDLTSAGGNVVVTVSGKYTTIDTAQYLVVTLPANVEFVSVAGGEDISEVDNPTEETVILYAFDEAANQIKFLEAYERDVDFAIEITVTVPEYSAEAYEYVIEANAQVAAFDAASSEDITTIEDSVTITVPAPHVHQAAADAAWQNNADNHWKVCAAHPDVKVEEAAHDYNKVVTEPTTEAGGYTTYTCKVCAYTYTADKTDPLPPAEPEKPEDVAVAFGFQKTLVLGSKIMISYTFRDRPEFPEYDRIYAVVTKERYADDAEKDSMETVIELNDKLSGGMYTFYYEGLAAKEMGKNVSTMIYAEDAEGNVVFHKSVADVYSVMAYALDATGFPGDDANAKKCLADMINYGAAAQKYFGYNTSDIISERKDIAAYVEQYDNDETITFKSVEGVGDDEFATNFNVNANLSLNSSIDFIAIANPARLTSYNLDDISVRFYWYNTKTKENQECIIYANDTENCLQGSTYNFYNRMLAAAQVSTEVRFAVYNGEQQISRTKIYSVESFCATQGAEMNSKNDSNLADALMKYGKSAALVLGY